jgi:hypothetical protein
VVPPFMRNGIWEEYVDRVEHMPGAAEEKTPPVAPRRPLQLSMRRRTQACVTPEMIDGTCDGRQPQLKSPRRSRSPAVHGLKEVSLLPPMMHIREIAREFAQKVIPLI